MILPDQGLSPTGFWLLGGRSEFTATQATQAPWTTGLWYYSHEHCCQWSPPPSHIVNTSAVSDDFKWGKKMDLLLGSLHLKDKEIEKAEHACKSLFYFPTARNSPSICRLLVWKNDVSSMCCKRRPGVQMRMFVRWIRADSCFRSCNRSKGKFYQLWNLHSIHFNCSNGSVPIRTES